MQKAALTFVVIGAGRLGWRWRVRFRSWPKRTLERDFGAIRGMQAHVVLLDAAPKVLPMFDDHLAASAIRQLEQLHIEVRGATKVLGVTPEGVQLENELLRARTVGRAAGNTASPSAKQLGAKWTVRAGRSCKKI